GRLARDQVRGTHVELGQRFLGYEQRRSAALILARQTIERRAGDAIDTILGERSFDQRRILADGREDQQPALQAPAERRVAHARDLFSGTPVSTPRYSRSGSPTWMRPSFMLNSRMVRSCAPPRIFITDTACRTSPSASK